MFHLAAMPAPIRSAAKPPPEIEKYDSGPLVEDDVKRYKSYNVTTVGLARSVFLPL
jgi:hypothetical protein